MDPEQNAYAVPNAVDQAPQRPEEADALVVIGVKSSRAARIAGAFLIANAAIVFASRAVMPSEPQVAGGSIVPSLIDVAIGASLLGGNARWRKWAIVRVALGVVLFGAIHGAAGDFASLALQMAISGSLLLLLVGMPGTARIVLGSTMFGVYALLSVVGIVTLASR
jgi:hypothetical protein